MSSQPRAALSCSEHTPVRQPPCQSSDESLLISVYSDECLNPAWAQVAPWCFAVAMVPHRGTKWLFTTCTWERWTCARCEEKVGFNEPSRLPSELHSLICCPVCRKCWDTSAYDVQCLCVPQAALEREPKVHSSRYQHLGKAGYWGLRLPNEVQNAPIWQNRWTLKKTLLLKRKKWLWSRLQVKLACLSLSICLLTPVQTHIRFWT